MPVRISAIRRHMSSLAVAAAVALLPALASAQVLQMGAMNTRQLGEVDKSRTVVIIPGGIMEEHGPYLPANTDGYVSERQARDLAEALVAEGWQVLLFPALPLGAGGANELAAKYPFPGTYVVRLDTLRAVYMDLADELGEAGFRWVFLVHSHGAPNHVRILQEASDYFTDTYPGRMLPVTGGMEAWASPDHPRRGLGEQARREDASSGHGGIDETSLMLFLEPSLVSPDYRDAAVFTAAGENGMVDVARRDDWQGYFGAPAHATAEYGARLYRLSTGAMVKEALEVLADPRPAARASRPLRAVDDAAIARDEAIRRRQQEWIDSTAR